MLKKVLIGIAALAVLAIVAAVALLALVDVDRYKPRIEQLAHDRFDRTLKFDGRLSLSVFPAIAVALPHTTLSQHGSGQPFLSLERARVSLALLPLLSGRLEAGTASLVGLRATIDRHADGTTSVDDLTGGSKPAADASASGTPGAAGPAPQFELGGIELTDAQLTVHDERTRNTLTVSKLNLKTGRLATRSSTPVELSASLASTAPQAALDVSLKGTIDLDLEVRGLGARALDAHARGKLGDDTLELTLAAPRLEVDAKHAAGESLKLTAVVTGAHPARAEFALENLSGRLDALSAERLAMYLEAGQGSQKFSARLAGPVTIALAAQSVELPKLAGRIDLTSPSLPGGTLKLDVDGSLRVDAKTQNVGAGLTVRFDDTALKSRVAVQGFSAPHIGFDVDVDRINLDRYLPSAPAAASGASGAAGAAASAPAAATGTKIDLSALKPLNLAGEVRVGALQVHGAKAAKLTLGIHAAGGRLELAPVNASLYQGSLGGSAKVDADGNRIAVNAALEGISIEPLLKDLLGKDVLEGHGNVKLAVTTLGPTTAAMRHALAGSASLALRDGAVHGINIAQKLRDLKSTLGGRAPAGQATNAAEKTDFSELAASFAIKDGVATNNDLQAKSPLLRLSGAGTIDIGAQALDYTAQASVVGTLSGQGGGNLADLRGVTVPVHMKGPFTALSYQLDWNAIARQALEKKAGDRLKILLRNNANSNGQAPANLGDALGGLLRK